MLLPEGGLDLCRNLSCGHPPSFIKWADYKSAPPCTFIQM
jgi:hypothetical protein